MSASDSTLPALPSDAAAAGKRDGGEARTAQMENPNLALPVQWKPRVNPWLIAMTVALAAFMEVLDTSIANVALPHIGGSLGASTDEATWVLTSYLVSNAIVLPLGGWASSVMGRRNFFVLCIAIFTTASFLCGAAPSLPILLLCRVIQGAGGGGLQPMAQAIMAEASWLRVVQMLPLPFCFISITNAAYVGMPKEQSNQVAGLINFVRNIGGSILIAITNAQVTSRALWHEQHLQQAMQPGTIAFDQRQQALAGFFSSHFGGANGAAMALARVYSQMKDQARTQGYQDVYMELCWASIVLIALSFMLSKNRPGEGAGGDGVL